MGYYNQAVAKQRLIIRNAGVAELADAQASGACGRKIVWVQVPSPALFFYIGKPLVQLGFPIFYYSYFLKIPQELF